MNTRSCLLVLLLVFLFVPALSAGPISSCQTLSSPNTIYTLTADIYTSSTCFNINAENITLDCAGHSLYGRYDGTYGVYSNSFNTTVMNCNISRFYYGVDMDSAPNASFINNSVYSNVYDGFALYSSDNATFHGNNITQNDVGILLWPSQFAIVGAHKSHKTMSCASTLSSH